MAQTVIEWVRNAMGELGYTFNAWIGCEHVSPACDHCYAEVGTPARVLRAKGHETWGPHAARHRTSDANWHLPLRWNRKAAAMSTRARVFCASQSDWLDNKVPIEWLVDLLDLVRRTPNLDWLMLSKRIGNWRRRLEDAQSRAHDTGLSELARWIFDWLNGRAPSHVGVGITVVNQEEVDRDVIKLLRTPAAMRFLSMEPLLAHVSFQGMFANPDNPLDGTNMLEVMDWVIVGGESGPKARPMHPDWVRCLQAQCESAGVPFFFKQWGEWHTNCISISDNQPVFRQFTSFQQWGDKASTWVNGGICLDKHGRVLKSGGDFMRARDQDAFPVTIMHRVGKEKAGRLLDGKLYDASPERLLEAA